MTDIVRRIEIITTNNQVVNIETPETIEIGQIGTDHRTIGLPETNIHVIIIIHDIADIDLDQTLLPTAIVVLNPEKVVPLLVTDITGQEEFEMKEVIETNGTKVIDMLTKQPEMKEGIKIETGMRGETGELLCLILHREMIMTNLKLNWTKVCKQQLPLIQK